MAYQERGGEIRFKSTVDRVITSGGLCGEIIAIGDQILTLEIADKVRVEVGRGHIAGFAPKK